MIFNQLFAFLFGFSNVSLIQKKTLTVNFRKSLDKKVRYINLLTYEELSFDVVKEQTEKHEFLGSYKLVMNTVTIEGGVREEKVLAYFESMRSAQAAKLSLQNKMYGRGQTIISFLVKVLAIMMLSYIILNQLSFETSRLRGAVQPSTEFSAPTSSLPMTITPEQQAKLRALAQTREVGQSPANTAPAEAPVSSQEPGVNFNAGSSQANEILRGR